MRLAAILFATLTSSMAFADEAKPADPPPAPPAEAPAPAPAPPPKAAKVPLRVVRVLAESHQALLFDKLKNTHVLADVGKTIDGFKVEDIDDDEVTLTAENGTQIVLAAPDPVWRRHRSSDGDGDEARPARPAKAPKTAAPEDPYAAAASPQDPYGEAPMRTVEAPGAMTKDGVVRSVESPDALSEIRAVDAPPKAVAGAVVPSIVPATAPTVPAASAPASAAPAAAAPAEAKPIDPTAAALAGALTGTPAAATAPAPADAPVVIPRTEVNAAIGNFGALAGSIRGEFTPAGTKLVSVADGSLFAKAGLRTGDTITAVNGQPLRSIDDAANVYARSSNAKLLTVQLQRAGKPMTLRVSIQ
jgi:hypothetical protein